MWTRIALFSHHVISSAIHDAPRMSYDSAAALGSLLELPAQEAVARRVHVLSWSAGARVATDALVVMRQRD